MSKRKVEGTTPRPWRVGERDTYERSIRIVCDSAERPVRTKGLPVADVLIDGNADRAEANAVLIARAVNAHDALVEALSKALAEFSVRGTISHGTAMAGNAALALAGAKP